jgi:hypothetical protein
MKRFAAKLLFQFRVVVDGDSGKRRTCEERIIVFDARSAERALLRAKRSGKKAEHHYLNNQGNGVFFEFIGVLDLLELGIECDTEEVWYDIVERLSPSERSAKIIPRESDLCAIRLSRKRRNGIPAAAVGQNPKREEPRKTRKIRK